MENTHEQTQDQVMNTDTANNQEESKNAAEAGPEEAPESSKEKDDKRWRAKLYQLNSDGGWDDLGTGYSFVDTKCDQLKLISENDNDNELLASKIALTTRYHRQRDTIITWLDEVTQMDLAISFQELEGAQETWEIICGIQGKDPEELSPEEGSDEELLPLPKLDNLSELNEELQTIDPQRRVKAVERIFENDEQFLKKLKEIFQTVEDLENEDGLIKVFNCFKSILNISDLRLYETLMSDEYYLTVFGALEYNPEISNKHQETKHRQFLSEKVKFKSLMEFGDQDILNKIHINYRLTYLKDTALATGLDEGNIQNIINLINNNNSDIVQSILLDQENITKVFEKLRDTNMETRKEAINFLTEIFNISKSLQMQGRLSLLSSFKNIEEFNLSIFVRECIKYKNEVLTQNDEKKDEAKLAEAERLVTNCLDILQNYLQSFPISFNDLCNGDKTSDGSSESEKLIKALWTHMLECTEQGLKLQIHELIKFLLEENSGLGSILYEQAFESFKDYLLKPKEEDPDKNNNLELTKGLILDIISRQILCIDNYNIKSYIDKHSFINAVNEMALCGSKTQDMSVLKFHKALLMSNFKPYITYLVHQNLIDIIVKIYENIQNKRGMVASIALEMFKIIDKDHHEMAKYLHDKYPQIAQFVAEGAKNYQPPINPKFEEKTSMMESYLDSVEDEKANQEAFERSIGISSEQEKQEKFKKIGFNLSNKNNEPEDEFLIKPRIDPSTSPKIEIETGIFQSLEKNKDSFAKQGLGSNSVDHVQGTSGAELTKAGPSNGFETNFEHEPIEFTKGGVLGEIDLLKADEKMETQNENEVLPEAQNEPRKDPEPEENNLVKNTENSTEQVKEEPKKRELKAKEKELEEKEQSEPAVDPDTDQSKDSEVINSQNVSDVTADALLDTSNDSIETKRQKTQEGEEQGADVQNDRKSQPEPKEENKSEEPSNNDKES